MAVITQPEIQPFKDLGLVNEQTFRDLADLSLKMRLKRGETGFSNVQIKNFTLYGHSCSPQVKEAILNYFRKRVEILKEVIKNV